jgi:nitrogenase-stabilizing/protective protein
MSTIDDLARLSSAEDFFDTLDVAYDPAVVNVARLHILRRMGQYLRGTSFDGIDDGAIRDACRAHLARAYADFEQSSPIQERVFKVHQDAIKPPSLPFVPLTVLVPQES